MDFIVESTSDIDILYGGFLSSVDDMLDNIDLETLLKKVGVSKNYQAMMRGLLRIITAKSPLDKGDHFVATSDPVSAKTFEADIKKLLRQAKQVQKAIRQGSFEVLELSNLTPIDDTYIPMHIGVETIFDNYLGFFAYIGREGYLLNSMLCIESTSTLEKLPEFLKETLHNLDTVLSNRQKETTQQVVFRLDAIADTEEMLAILQQSGYDYIVQSDLGKRTPEAWLEEAESHGNVVLENGKKRIFQGCLQEQAECYRVYYVTEILTDKLGTFLFIPEIEVEIYRTSFQAPDIVKNLYTKQETTKQFYDDLSQVIPFEQYVLSSLRPNEFMLELMMLAFNVRTHIMQATYAGKSGFAHRKTISREETKRTFQIMVDIAKQLVDDKWDEFEE